MSFGITVEPLSKKWSRKKRSENWLEEDKNLLFDLVCARIDTIEHKSNCTDMNMKKKETWDEIVEIFNASCKGHSRTADQVRLTWKRMKLTIKKESPALFNDLKNGFKDSLPPPSSKHATLKVKRVKTKPSSLFKNVRQLCVALIMTHGRPVDLLDDAAFRDLLALIPITEQERAKITSSLIREFIDDEDKWSADSFGEDDDDDGEGFEDSCDDGDKTDEEIEKANSPLKYNVDIEPAECSCTSFRDAGTHETGCVAIAQDSNWQYFEMAADEATCKLCSQVMQWTSTSDLRVHLTIHHPSVVVTDHEDEFTTDRGKQTSKSDNSIANVIIEEIFVSEDLPSKAKKRKYRPSTVVTLNDSKTLSIERFKSLDRFGLYVASLLKLLPVEKSREYQEQIVQTLIKEQAAAG